MALDALTRLILYTKVVKNGELMVQIYNIIQDVLLKYT